MTTTKLDFDALRRDRAALEDALRAAGASIQPGQKNFRCPFHPDGAPSATIFSDESGALRFRCHAGSCGASGDVLDVRARSAGQTRAEVIRAITGTRPAPARTPSATPAPAARIFPTRSALQDAVESVADRQGKRLTAGYEYLDESGTLRLLVYRLEGPTGKSFLQTKPEGAGFVFGAPKELLPLFNLRSVAEAPEVIICEGEKAAAVLIALGFCAVTSAGGCKNAGRTDWRPLAGKAVVLWPDNDEPGAKYADDVTETLRHLDPPAIIRRVDPARLNLPLGGDAADVVAELEADGKDPSAIVATIRAILAGADSLPGPSAEVREEIEQAISGERCAIEWPWPFVTSLTDALRPGSVCVLAGGAGASKSLWLLLALAYWYGRGVAASALMLEDNRAFHTRRALAQRCGLAGLTNDGWCKANPERARRALIDNQAFADGFQRCLAFVPKTEDATVDFALGWLKERVAAGERILAVDPFTLLDFGEKTFIEESRFIREAKRVVEDTAASLIIVCHPRKGAGALKPEFLCLDDLAGSAALTRASQCVLWLRAHDDELSTVTRQHGREAVTYNRTMHLMKTRSAGGQGRKIAFQFDPQTLRFREAGLIATERA
jgi:hypothetical protein